MSSLDPTAALVLALRGSFMSPREAELEFTAAGLPGAECAFDPELHTGPRDVIESPQERAAREDVAKEVCATCPVRAACQAYALRNRPTWGVWAGRTVPEIAALASVELGEVA